MTGVQTCALPICLPDGGWRNGAVAEILSDINDDSGLNLVMPALATVSREKKWLVWVSPPQFLDRFKLANAGIDISRVLLVHPRTSANGLWLVGQVLRAGTCSAVLTWMTGGDAGDVKNADSLRRLQLAAEAGGCLGFVFRQACYARETSPVTTRLLLNKRQQHMQLEILGDQSMDQVAPQVLKFSANRLNRQRGKNQGRASRVQARIMNSRGKNYQNLDSRPKNLQLSLY